MSGALKRDEWETTKWYSLKDLSVTKLEYGSGASAIPYDGDVRYLRITDIAVDGSLTEDFVSPNVYDSKYLLKEDDLLFARTGATVGKTLLFKEKYGKCIYAGFLIRLVPNKDLVVPEYLYYFTKSPRYLAFVQKSMKVVAQPNINAKQYGDLKISLPSLDVQRRIADTLDKVTELITLRKTQLEKLDELVKSRFVELFGDRYTNDKNWENKPLYECADFYNGKAHEQVVDENGEYILVTSRCIASDITDYRRTNALLFPLKINDIAMVMSDVPNGRALAKCILIDEDDKYTLNQRICCLRNYLFNPIFFYYLLNRHEYFLSFNDGNAQTNLRKDDLLACNIIMPPLELQNQFAAFVEQTDKSKVIIQQNLDTLETLKKSLMQEYFG